MGNSFGCSASGERLVSAARDGDLVEAKMLLDCNPCLAKYSTFGGLNSPLHFAAAKGHNEIVSLLLENGADVNSRNYCGQTAVMQACRYGHWEVVQTLLIFRCNVMRADYLSGRSALHFAAVNGHVRCLRLIVADFVPSVPYEAIDSQTDPSKSDGANVKSRCEQGALSKFVNKAADGGITALHMAALNGYYDCVHLLLDLHANVSAVTFHYGTSMDLIGAGSTPLHYAACGGNLKCCQILLARGASRTTLNCNGWLPLDVARMWGRHWLEPLVAPNSVSIIPGFPTSNYLSLPLLSALNIARDCGFKSMGATSDDGDTCAVCLERVCSVAAEGCGHELCVRCALYLCSTSNIQSQTIGSSGSIPCPLCRHAIISFVKLSRATAKEKQLHLSLSICNPCILHTCDAEDQASTCTPEIRKNRVASVSSDVFCPVTCSPFPSAAIPLCTCNDGPCPTFEPRDVGTEDESPRHLQTTPTDQDKLGDPRQERTSCSSMFWGRRSGSRENQCNSEINA
ncbi:E3 ubiquitin-protein ligase XBAT33-like isoform X1 [Cucurbita moschata]|uniref:RING-type E3 ubiquitin transferase n=2 Tax=Cucurbita moschata TaxID=3662 RepID=A0A6J1H1H7_CUCMO|nr:E3 ubiquitin-protein ligase XBAT33-like isoform X1 [Cucurbita moschata]